MRVTQNMLNSDMLRNLSGNLQRLRVNQDQLSTGKRINKPSDDPVGTGYALRYRSELNANDQYQRNVDSANSWLDYTDTMMGQAGDVLQRARELAVQGANGTNPQEALDSIAQEVGQLYNQLVTVGNSQFNGKHVFNGQITDRPPYTAANADNESTDNGQIGYEIGTGVVVPVNLTGEQAFGTAGATDNAFKVLKDLQNALKNGDTTQVSQLIGNFDTRINSFLEQRADLGARSHRLELAENRLKDININLQSLQSRVEDVDMAAAITNLKTQENVYEASLSAGARIIRPSLIDFLK